MRSKMLLNGEPVSEPDFSQLHATILYASRGMAVPGDAYTISGYERDSVKTAFQAIINARSTNSAIGAVQKELKLGRSEAAKMVRDIKSTHKNIAEDFASDKGVRMMRTDSDILISVMLKLVEHNIPFLPVHDLIVCPKVQLDRVKDVMRESFKQAFPGYPCKVK